MGLVLIGILNGSITTAITTFSVDFDFTLHGKAVWDRLNIDCSLQCFRTTASGLKYIYKSTDGHR